MAEILDVWAHAHNIIRSARQIVNADLRPLNLSSAEGNILLHLLIQNQAMRQEQLAEELDVSRPAVSRALDSLEAKGFITRQPDPDDRRVRWVRLTDHARSMGPAVAHAYNQLYALATQGISEEELGYFVKLFNRMSENLTHVQINKDTEAQNDT